MEAATQPELPREPVFACKGAAVTAPPKKRERNREPRRTCEPISAAEIKFAGCGKEYTAASSAEHIKIAAETATMP